MPRYPTTTNVKRKQQPQARRTPQSNTKFKEGKPLAVFKVKAQPGFNISSFHKFFIVPRKGRAVIEYCKICKMARRFLRINGADVDYVKNAIDNNQGWPLEGTDWQVASNQFSLELIAEYQRLTS